MEIEAERGLGPVAPIIAPRVLNYRLDFRAIPSCGTIFVAAKAQHIDWLLPDYVLFTQSERYRLVPESCHRYSILQANLTKLTFSILKRVRGVVHSQIGSTDFKYPKKSLDGFLGFFGFFFWVYEDFFEWKTLRKVSMFVFNTRSGPWKCSACSEGLIFFQEMADGQSVVHSAVR